MTISGADLALLLGSAGTAFVAFLAKNRREPVKSPNSPAAADSALAQTMSMRDGGGPCSCPCCGHMTLEERNDFEICVECGWADDGQDDHDSDVVYGGPNGELSLDAARAAYVARGGTRLPHQPPAEPR